ncbi:hypothetical protein LNP25_26875 [Klebsiella variicola subsp. variicola]|nr:hypothetical protein [Klebsiella variicola subsp. variicola]
MCRHTRLGAPASRRHARCRRSDRRAEAISAADSQQSPPPLPGYPVNTASACRALPAAAADMMNLITMHQLHRSQLGIGKGGGFVDIEKSVADASGITSIRREV